jgi:glycosyltransferase involved in cell wall biosynthesis
LDVPSLPTLTVALPTFNGARHLAEALRSILAQEQAEFDLLVCDDQSQDETADVLRSVAGDRARLEINRERLGLAGNWNRCIDRSRTEWVAVFHQDDVMLAGHLAAQLRAISAANDERLGLVASAASVIDDSGKPVPVNVVDPGGIGVAGERTVFAPPRFATFLASSNPLRCSAVTTRRSAHAAVGGFHQTFRYVVDWEFWRRVALKWSVAWLGGPPTVAVRWHLESETHRFKTGAADLEETERLVSAILADKEHPAADPEKVLAESNRRLSQAYLNRAYEAARAGQGALVRSCLRSALRLSPNIIGRIASDPRLAGRLLLALGRK